MYGEPEALRALNDAELPKLMMTPLRVQVPGFLFPAASSCEVRAGCLSMTLTASLEMIAGAFRLMSSTYMWLLAMLIPIN